MSSIVKNALITEKSFAGVANGKFVFIVDKAASKEAIALECQRLFNVTVLEVNTARFKGKVKRGRKGEGVRSDFKKAFVSVKPGQKIDLFEIQAEEEKKEEKKPKEKKEEK